MNKALIIVDMQYGFMNDNTKHLENKAIKFIDGNKDKFKIIIATQYVNHEKSPCYIFEGWKDCMNGTQESKVLSSIYSRSDIVISKDIYSCWNEQIKNKMKELNIDKVYFIGVNTGCCVLHSAFDAYNDLQDCAVIEDLCGSTSGENSHKAAIQILRECITKQRVITIKQFEEEE
jgi:nicotinamidase-related amidase